VQEVLCHVVILLQEQHVTCNRVLYQKEHVQEFLSHVVILQKQHATNDKS
jgi:hypothetical protein